MAARVPRARPPVAASCSRAGTDRAVGGRSVVRMSPRGPDARDACGHRLSRRRRDRRFRVRVVARQPDGEGAAAAVLAGAGDFPAQQPAEFPHDERPNPVPPCSRVMASAARPSAVLPRAWRNFSKITPWSSSGMPTPVSVTTSSNHRRTPCPPCVRFAPAGPAAGPPAASRGPRSRPRTRTSPPGPVNLIALESRLFSTCCSLPPSWRSVGRCGSTRTDRVTPFFSATGRSASHWRSARSDSETSPGQTSSLPLSILARSRMSSISSFRSRPPLRMLPTHFFCLPSSDGLPSSTSLKPRMLFSGVRSS